MWISLWVEWFGSRWNAVHCNIVDRRGYCMNMKNLCTHYQLIYYNPSKKYCFNLLFKRRRFFTKTELKASKIWELHKLLRTIVLFALEYILIVVRVREGKRGCDGWIYQGKSWLHTRLSVIDTWFLEDLNLQNEL